MAGFKLNRNLFHALVPALILAVFGLGIAGGYFFFSWKSKTQTEPKDIYSQFTKEVYQTIKQNYWEKISDEGLAELFRLGAEKVSQEPKILESPDARGAVKMTNNAIADFDDRKKKEFVVQLADLVLTNLKPFGRSRLYAAKEEKELAQNVQNINPETGKIEPTVLPKLLTPDILHLKLTKLSPQTFEEFQKIAEEIDKTQNPSSLILDLRGNVGGSIDLLQYFLGPFIGQNQYAYEFFHQGETKPFKTLTGWLPSLVRYKKVVILVDGQTQSSAELMAGVLKKYNVGALVGQTTKGWGTVEAVFPLKNQFDAKEKYSLFLVHSLSLGDDNQPIEGKGIDPLINITNQDWPQELFAYLHYQELVDAVKNVINNK